MSTPVKPSTSLTMSQLLAYIMPMKRCRAAGLQRAFGFGYERPAQDLIDLGILKWEHTYSGTVLSVVPLPHGAWGLRELSQPKR